MKFEKIRTHIQISNPNHCLAFRNIQKNMCGLITCEKFVVHVGFTCTLCHPRFE